MTSTLYRPLTPSQNEIRLLHLFPGAGDDPIKSGLRVVTLNSNLSYEACLHRNDPQIRLSLLLKALSYCWGSKGERKTVMLDGQSVSVSKNLYAALRTLRLPQSTRHLWIDALCINQSDSVEKSQQVACMGGIYRQTDRCLIWLGEEPDAPEPMINKQEEKEVAAALDQADDLLKNLSSLLHQTSIQLPPDLEAALKGDFGADTTPREDTFRITKTRSFDWFSTSSESLPDLMQDITLRQDSVFHGFCMFRLLADDQHLHDIPYFVEEPPDATTIFTNARRAAHWILNRPWFHRIWTVQECHLPTTSMVLYGAVRAPWQMFLDAVDNFQRHRASCCSSVPGVNDMMDHLIDALGEISRLRQAKRDGKAINLSSILRVFQSRQATDQRDKVYGLLPLVDQWYTHQPILPDYSSATTAEHVYTRTVLKLIETSGSLDVLAQPTYKSRDKFKLLPSWVPNYADTMGPRGTSTHFSQQRYLYNASGGVRASVKSIEENIIVTEAVRIGKIQTTARTVVSFMVEPKSNIFEEWFGLVDSPKPETIKDWRQGFWRTICGDCISRDGVDTNIPSSHNMFRRLAKEDQRAFHSWCVFNRLNDIGCCNSAEEHARRDVPLDEATKGTGCINSTVRASTMGKKLFISQDGKLGLAPSYTTMTSDEIFVIPGGRTPFVLRPVGSRHVPGMGMTLAYEMIGECYFHGFMDGQGMADFEAEKEVLYLV